MKRTVVVAPQDERRIAEIVQNFPFSSRHGVIRLAVHVGLDELERDPERLVAEVRKQAVSS